MAWNCSTRAPPPKMAPPASKPPDSAADAKVRFPKRDHGAEETVGLCVAPSWLTMQGTGDASEKKPAKKSLPPPSNPPPQGTTSAAAAFRAKSALPPPSGPPPNGPTTSASVAKIRGAARPPSGAPPSAGSAPSKPALAPPSGVPPPSKGEAKAAAQPPFESADSKTDSVKAAPSDAKVEVKRSAPPPSTRPPSAGGAKPIPTTAQPPPTRAATVDVLSDSSPAITPPTVKPAPASASAPISKPAVTQPKPATHPPVRPATAEKLAMPMSSQMDNSILKPQIVKKSTMEVLNDTSAAISASRRNPLGEGYDSPLNGTPPASARADETANGVYTTKVGRAAQYSGLARPNAPDEEEIIVVKKVETKPVVDSDDAKSVGETKPTSGEAKPGALTRHQPRLDDSFDDVEEIPFLDELKPEPKSGGEASDAKTISATTRTTEGDSEVVVEHKRVPPKARGESGSPPSDAKEQAGDNSRQEKDDDGDSSRGNDASGDMYHELHKPKRSSPRDDSAIDSFSTQSAAASGLASNVPTNNERKESRDSENDSKDSATDEGHGPSSRDKAREKRRERRRHKHDDEPKKIQAQVCSLCLPTASWVFVFLTCSLLRCAAVLQPEERAIRARPLAGVCQEAARVWAWTHRQVLYRAQRQRIQQTRTHLHATA